MVSQILDFMHHVDGDTVLTLDELNKEADEEAGESVRCGSLAFARIAMGGVIMPAIAQASRSAGVLKEKGARAL